MTWRDPAFLYLLSCCILSTNGARLKLFGRWRPIVLWTLSTNFSQTRKSGLTSVAETACRRVDEKLKQLGRRISEDQRSSCLAWGSLPGHPLVLNPGGSTTLSHVAHPD